jgi:hypothetical protein
MRVPPGGRTKLSEARLGRVAAQPQWWANGPIGEGVLAVRRALLIASCAGLLAQAGNAGQPRVNVVVDAVRAVSAGEGSEDEALLVVFVVDDAGDPIDEVAVVVSARGQVAGSVKTDSRGRAMFHFDFSGPVTVRAADAGLVPAVARGVMLRKGGVTALALPLEQASSG